MRKIHTLAAVAALSLAGGAYAQTQGAAGLDVDANASVKMTQDKNSDGKISKSEAASDSKLAKQFDSLDANKDGNLDKGEFAKFEATGKGALKGGAVGKDEGDPANPDKPGMDDSTPGNEDKLGPGR
jgi:hypothetical protein